MAMYNNDTNWHDSLARVLAIVALIIAIGAFLWAVKADRRANDAWNTANQTINNQTAPVSDIPQEKQNPTTEEPTGQGNNGNTPDQTDTSEQDTQTDLNQ
jgi:hypothetical protein